MELCYGFGCSQNALKLFSVKENGWSQFVEAVNDRITQLNCNGRFIIGNGSGQAFKAKRGPKEFVICSTCYSDYMQYSVFSFEFEEATSLASGTEPVCGMNIFSMLTAWNRAVARNDFDLWLQAARVTSNNPNCLASGIENYLVHSSRRLQGTSDGSMSIVSCGSHGIRRSREFFVPRDAPSKESKVCWMNPAQPHFARAVPKLQEDVDKQVFSIFSDFAKTLVAARPCKQLEPESNVPWFGFEDCTFCPNCWYSHIDGTKLADKATLRGDKAMPGPQVCNMGTPGMRNKWWLACLVNDLNGFKEFAATRRQAWKDIQQRVEAINQRQQMRVAQASNYVSQAAFWDQTDITNSVNVGSGSSSTTVFDPSSGMYLSPEKIKANECRRMMSQLFAENNKERMYLEQLEAEWQKVE
jgi:hypothetical protein